MKLMLKIIFILILLTPFNSIASNLDINNFENNTINSFNSENLEYKHNQSDFKTQSHNDWEVYFFNEEYIPQFLNILVYKKNSSFNSDVARNYDQSYNYVVEQFGLNDFLNCTNIIIVDEYDFSKLIEDDIDVLIFAKNIGLHSGIADKIRNWYESGNKLLWVSGDSDYNDNDNSHYKPDNTFFENLGSVLRITQNEIIDNSQNYQGGSHQIVGKGTSHNSNVTELIWENANELNTDILMHGSAGVAVAKDDGEYVNCEDLRKLNLENYDYYGNYRELTILLETSEYAYIDNFDGETGYGTCNPYYEEDKELSTGKYPLIVMETYLSSHIIVSGEIPQQKGEFNLLNRIIKYVFLVKYDEPGIIIENNECNEIKFEFNLNSINNTISEYQKYILTAT